MKKIIRQLEQYFRETLGITVTPHPLDLKNLGIKSQSLDSILAELRRLYVHD